MYIQMLCAENNFINSRSIELDNIFGSLQLKFNSVLNPLVHFCADVSVSKRSILINAWW